MPKIDTEGGYPDVEAPGIGQIGPGRLSTTGIRYEWFSDQDATRVNTTRASDYFAATIGFNWTPTDCITVRPSLRWDWVDTTGYYPFADGTEHDQILIDCDVIWRF